MASKVTRTTIKITLTPEQRDQLRQATGQDTSVLELTPEELEERIAPSDGAMSVIQNLKA